MLSDNCLADKCTDNTKYKAKCQQDCDGLAIYRKEKRKRSKTGKLHNDKDDTYLYRNFEKAMVSRLKKHRVQQARDMQLALDNGKKTLAYKKGGLIFAYNFHPVKSYEGCFVPVPEKGEYDVVMSTDDFCYGGHGRIAHQTYSTVENADGKTGFYIYLPSRTAAVLQKIS